MNNKDFDKFFKDQLANKQQEGNTPDWDVFSEILKKSEGFENIDFDHSIKEKVSQHHTPYNESHWQLLKARLEKEEKLRKNIFSIKSLELIALLLVFLGWQSYQASLNKIPEIYAAINGIGSVKHKKTAETSPISNVFSESYAFSHMAYQPQKAEVVVALMPTSTQQPLVSFDPSHALPGIKDHALLNLKRLPGKNVSTATSVSHPTMPALNLAAVMPEIKAAAARKYIMPVISAGVGITQSGFDPIYNLKSYSTYSSQFAGGLILGFQNDELETTTGIKYTRRTHQPAAIVETYGDFLNNYYEISLDKIGYDIVEIPVAAKYHFKKSGKTSWYAKAGVSGNFTLANHYKITNKPASFQPLAPSNVGYSSDGDNKSTSSRLSEKEFNHGLLQGGKLSENWFLTVSGELGMEHKLNETHALVLGAEYSKFYWIDGIGPNKDKLNGFAINLGIKKYLN